jgi:hypothetical protein
MSNASKDVLTAVKRRFAEEERQRKEHEAWLATPAGRHGKDFGARLGPWILELARGMAEAQKIPVVATHVTSRSVRADDPHDWPCDRGEFEATVHRFPGGSVEPGFKSTPFLMGCRCPPADAWAIVVGLGAAQEGLLSYGILPGHHQSWFTVADLGDKAESAHHFDGTAGYDQIAPGEIVVQVRGVAEADDPEHPCSLGAYSMTHATNFYYPVRGAAALFGATLEGFLRGEPLVPQFQRHPAGG